MTALEQIRHAWRTILQFGIWLTAIALLIMAEPPRFLASDPLPNTATKTAELVVAIAAAICFYRFGISGGLSRRRLTWWGSGLLIGGLVISLIYQVQYELWTSSYDGRGPVTIGTSLLPDAAQYLQEHPQMTNELLLQVYGGHIEKIWPRTEIVVHHLLMIITFLAGIVSFSLSILFVCFGIVRDEPTEVDRG